MGVNWMRKLDKDTSPSYTRLTSENNIVHKIMSTKVRKGYVPVVVGGRESGEDELQRFLVHVKLLKEPCMAALLELAAEEFGYQQQGVLRVLCDAHSFQHTINLISHSQGR